MIYGHLIKPHSSIRDQKSNYVIYQQQQQQKNAKRNQKIENRTHNNTRDKMRILKRITENDDRTRKLYATKMVCDQLHE